MHDYRGAVVGCITVSAPRARVQYRGNQAELREAVQKAARQTPVRLGGGAALGGQRRDGLRGDAVERGGDEDAGDHTPAVVPHGSGHADLVLGGLAVVHGVALLAHGRQAGQVLPRSGAGLERDPPPPPPRRRRRTSSGSSWARKTWTEALRPVA
ncbi:hypothetical protein GCM10023081_13180 [Arthrobacter ginkgonis]|uniref:Uncharacterized protein n=1 Tax=Arthrobacter ginkgonis TaxID=1630594 RepID=A0ABP7C4K8_9MICC